MSITVFSLKGRLELITGVSSSSMRLEVFDRDEKAVCTLDNDDAQLISYPIRDGMRVHVAGDTPLVMGESLASVPKYEMSKEDYEKRTDSVLAFKKKQKMGRFAEKDEEAEKAALEEEERQAKLAEEMKVGDRCEVRLAKDSEAKRGTVMFVGKTDFKPGWWIGVKYDEPLGKNDGSSGGKKYFSCPPKYGAFVRPTTVTVGDFPEESYSDDEL
jgi:tubulin-folding cofactor B